MYFSDDLYFNNYFKLMAQEVILVRDGKTVAKLNLEEIEAISGSTFA
jgi:hypothetical protein